MAPGSTDCPSGRRRSISSCTWRAPLATVERNFSSSVRMVLTDAWRVAASSR